MPITAQFLYQTSGANLGFSVECLETQLFWNGTTFGSESGAHITPLTEGSSPFTGVYSAVLSSTPANVFIDGLYVCYLHDIANNNKVMAISEEFSMANGDSVSQGTSTTVINNTSSGSSFGISAAPVVGPHMIGTASVYSITAVNLSDGTTHPFNGSETLTATIWNHASGTSYANPTVAIAAASTGLMSLVVTAADSLLVPSPDRYGLTITYSTGGDATPVFDGAIVFEQGVDTPEKPPGLISVDRALAALPNIPGNQVQYVPSLILAASRLVESYCNRHFLATDFDEIYDGNGFGTLMLRNFPVNRVDRVSINPLGVLKIYNNDETNVQRASIKMDTGVSRFHFRDMSPKATGISLQATQNGVVQAAIVLTFAAHPTIQSLVDAINVLGNGWIAEVTSPYGKWPSSDLRAPQGSLDGAQGKQPLLFIYTKDLDAFSVVPEIAELRFASSTSMGPISGFGPYFYMDPDPFTPRGPGAVRILYNAGFDEVPEDVQQAVAITVQKFYDDMRTSQIYESEKLGDYEYRLLKRPMGRAGIPEAALGILNIYRDYRD